MVDPSGKFVLVANQAAQSVSAFAINQATGALPVVATTVTPVNVNATSMAMSGNFLYLAGNNRIDGYVLDRTTGTLTPMPGTPFQFSNLFTSLTSLVVAPSGSFLYAANSATPNIHVFSLNSTTGIPTLQGSGGASSTDPTSIAMNPAGTLLFAANPSNNSVTTFFVNAATGSFGSTFPVNTSITTPKWIAYDTTNNLLLVLNSTNRIGVFTVNSTTGALTQVPGSPFVSGVNPAAIAIAKP